MKELKISLLLLPIIILLNSCEGNFICTKADGPVVTEERFTSDFEGIELRGSADVVIRQDSVTRVVVQAQSSVHHQITTTVIGNKLVIDMVGCVKNADQIIVYASSPEFKDIELNGSGTIISDGLIVMEDIDVLIDGSGEVELELETEDLETRITGSGDIDYEGTADDHSIEIDGSGSIKSFDLETDTTDVYISGSGDCKVRVNEELNITISGSGDVYFKGNPVINSSVSGSGNIIDAN